VSESLTWQRTRRGVLSSLVPILAVCLAAAPASSAGAGLQISEGSGATFPARSLVLSIPGDSLQPSQVHVSENRRAVGNVVVRRVAHAGAGDFGIVLAIDISPSMQGKALDEAMAAARSLAAQRSGQQQLGVLVFDQTATVLLPLTADAHAITAALARTPTVGGGTHIYDALSAALQQLATSRDAAGAVILLSDGADRGSTASEQGVAAAARASHISLYTVGVRDKTFDATSLRMLARDGGGQFVQASASQLRKVFTSLEAGLTSRYVVRYRSGAPLGHRVEVSVSVDGVPQVGTLAYDTPAPAPVAAAKHPAHKSFWVSSLALVVFACSAAIVLGFGFFVFLVPLLRRARLQQRVGEFTVPGAPEVPEIVDAPSSSPLPALERLLARTQWWEQFKTDVEIARISAMPVQLIAFTMFGMAAGGLFLGLLLGTPWFSILILPLGPLLLREVVRHRLHKQRGLFADQLPAHLQELASAMRAGHSLVSAITSMAREAPEPAHSEWGRVVADEQLGVPLDEAMGPLAQRMDSDDIGQVALVAALHQRTGGNMAEVLELVADSVRERGELRRELHALTAQARLSRYVVTALPPVVLAAVAVLNPGYIDPLFHTTAGVVLIFIASGLLVGASLVMRAITNIKV
jgi:tight adherence protein B